jgi:stearoyl-CoA desaturase (delta-9 desaturase)
MTQTLAKRRSWIVRATMPLIRWFDSAHGPEAPTLAVTKVGTDWMRVVPFAALHLACFTVIWVGVSPVAVGVCLGLYVLRMFAITAGYHRYFSHRTFKTSRVGQFLFAFIGASAAQRGPLWWAAHHRVHHQYSDLDGDVHSPTQKGFYYSHVGWVLSREHFETKFERVKDLARFPELRFLDRFDILVPISLGVATFALGWILEAFAPGLGTTKWQMLVWGFVISTVALYHATFTINSLSHLWGFRRFATRDTSRNNPLLAVITMGEGWHNNHHFYPGSARQGFKWYEFDISYTILKVLSVFGLVWDLRPVPESVWERTIASEKNRATGESR